jgi:hypothetical protein
MARASVAWVLGLLACARPVETGVPGVAAAAVEPGASEVAAAAVEPAGVDPSLLTRATLSPGDVEEKCHAPLYRARCLQARQHPEVRLLWSLTLGEYYRDERGNDVRFGEAELRERLEQVVEFARADGVRDSYPDSRLTSVTLLGPYTAVRRAMALPQVDSVTPSCAEDDREFCACERLRVDQCEAHAFCQGVYGWPRCREPRVLAGCTRAETCRDSITHAYDPRGVKWEFPDSCVPDQPGWRSLGSVIDMTTGEPRCERLRD